MSSKQTLTFDVSANLQKLVGEELVTNDEMAIIELVKNAYDSGALNVTITILTETARQPALIKIEDDGPGMSLPEFKRIFMFAGYSERETEAITATRIPTGEKGIGRFAADKLGSKLELVTKKSGAKQALEVNFDWTAFRDKKKKFDEIEIPYKYITCPDLPEERSGTILSIRSLRANWNRKKVQSIRDSLASLLNPFGRPERFNIVLQVPDIPDLSGDIRQDPPETPDYEVRFKVSEDGKFLHRKLKSATSTDKGWKVVVTKATLNDLRGLSGRLLYYVKRPSKKEAKGLPHGVQVFRDGFRLQPFGAPLEQWLQLTEKRAKRAGHAPLVPNRLFGFIEVSRLLQPGIRDISSRQGLMETEEFHQMITVIRDQTDFLEENIREQVSIPSWRESGKEKAIEIERSKVQTLGDLSIGIGHEIRQPLQSIMSEAGAIQDRLDDLQIKDALIQESLETIDDGIRRIDETIRFIQDFAKGDLEAVSQFDLAAVVKKTCRLFAADAKRRGINITTKIPETQGARTSKNTFERVLVNILRNAVQAIEETRNYDEGEIEVKLYKEKSEHVLVVTDNGGGIPKGIRAKIFKTFATKKTAGLGYGLSHSQTIIQAHGGKISFETEDGVGTTFVVRLPDTDE
jgi:signal transduction histidine kinase